MPHDKLVDDMFYAFKFTKKFIYIDRIFNSI